MLIASYSEIVGLAGSGKTLAKDELVQTAHNNGIVVYDRKPLNPSIIDCIKIMAKFLSFVINNPVILKWWITPLSKKYASSPYASTVIRNLKFRSVIESIIINQFIKLKKIPFINDEGIIGKVVVLSLLIECDIEEVISLLDLLLPSDTEIIMLEIKIEQALAQMNNRGSNLPFWDNMEPILKIELCEKCKVRYMEICNERSNQKKLNHHVISNYGSKEELKSSIKSLFSCSIQDNFNL